MEKVDLTKYNFTFNGQLIDHAIIKPILFKTFVDLIDQITAIQDNAEFEKKLARLRMIEQLKFVTNNGLELTLQQQDIPSLPIKVGMLLQAVVKEQSTPIGEVLMDGDGIQSPVLYKLGTAIKTNDGEISELEFQAKTYGDVEDILAETSGIRRAYKMITSISTPICNDLKMIRTPEKIAEQIQLIDGLAIAQTVAPRFFNVDAN